jgi:RND superfamily putative drug exporter
VIVALAGLFVLGIGFVNGLAIASMLTVLFVMLSALWLLPALISQFGRKTFALKLPWARTVKVHPKGTLFARYGQWIQGRSILLVVGSLVAMVVIAIPTLSLQQGFADAPTSWWLPCPRLATSPLPPSWQRPCKRPTTLPARPMRCLTM